MQTSQIVDFGQFQSATIVASIGAAGSAGAAFNVTGTQGNQPNLSDGVPMTAADLVGTLGGFGWTGSTGASPGLNSCRKIGYVPLGTPTGPFRYFQFVVTPTGNSIACGFSMVAVLGHPKQLPQSAQTS